MTTEQQADAAQPEPLLTAQAEEVSGDLYVTQPVPNRRLFADAGLSPQALKRKALRLAVWLLWCEAVIALLSAILSRLPIQFVTFAVEMALAIALQRNQKWARTATMVTMTFALIVTLVVGLFFGPMPPLAIALRELPYIAILLMLAGQPQPWRLTFARCVLILLVFLTLVALPASVGFALSGH